MATYMRFIPYIKKNYDYGVVVFLLTFNLIGVSSYRVDEVLKMANERFYTIAIGCAICLLMSLLIFPNWSGQHLHESTVFKIQGLADSIQGMYYCQVLFLFLSAAMHCTTTLCYFGAGNPVLSTLL